MALHGTIEINGRRIGVWTATCGPRHEDGYAEYRWETLVTAPPASPAEAHLDRPVLKRAGTLTHRYTDGALALAAQVLAAATAERDRDLEAVIHD